MKIGLGLLLGMVAVSALANTLEISLTPTMPVEHHWPGNASLYGIDWQFEDQIQAANVQGWQGSINLAGINSISVTWNAPANYMYVVNPPPSDLGRFELDFELQYGKAGEANSLGQITGSSISMNVVYGNLQPTGGATLNDNDGLDISPGLDFHTRTFISSDTSAFAFTSITITANFNGDSPSGILTANNIGFTAATYYGVLFGVPTTYGLYNGPGDPGQLLTIQPLPSDNVPALTSSLALAGISAIGLMAFGRFKRH